MKSLLHLFVLLFLLVSCHTEEPERVLTFRGHAQNGDLDPSSSMHGIWVKISCYGDGLTLLETDSVRTDPSGNYSFTIPDSESLKWYSIQVRDPYYFTCIGFPQPAVNNFILPSVIDKTKATKDTLSVCVTGNVILTITKSGVAKDTLTIIPKIRMPSVSLIEYPTTVYKDTVLTFYYFSKSVSSVEYTFKLKKESGETEEWTDEELIEGQTTKTLNLSF